MAIHSINVQINRNADVTQQWRIHERPKRAADLRARRRVPPSPVEGPARRRCRPTGDRPVARRRRRCRARGAGWCTAPRFVISCRPPPGAAAVLFAGCLAVFHLVGAFWPCVQGMAGGVHESLDGRSAAQEPARRSAVPIATPTGGAVPALRAAAAAPCHGGGGRVFKLAAAPRACGGGASCISMLPARILYESAHSGILQAVQVEALA